MSDFLDVDVVDGDRGISADIRFTLKDIGLPQKSCLT